MRLLNLLFPKAKETKNEFVSNDITSQYVNLKIYRLKSDFTYPNGYKIEKGRVFAQWHSLQNGSEKSWIMATPKLCARWGSGYAISELRKNNLLEQIFVEDIEKLKPHWHKEFKEILNYTKSIIQKV